MNYFDLHCDTVSKAFDEKLNLESEKLQVQIKKADTFEKYNQCFALFVHDRYKKDRAQKRAEELFKFYEREKDCFEKQDSLSSFLTLENCECFNENADNISFWKNRGVIMGTLTWNGENALGCGCLTQSGGLKPFGFKAITEMENNKIIVDVSHLNEDGFRDVLKKAERPFVSSHTACYTIKPHKRNLKDSQIKSIISASGLVGLCFYPEFYEKRNIYNCIFENIKYILSLGGEDVLAFGSDFDGGRMSKQLDKTDKIKNLYAYLSKKGLEKELLEKIFFKNAEKFFNNVLQ